MAFASVGSFITGQTKDAGTSDTYTTSATLSGGQLAVLVVASDNLGASDGATDDHTGVLLGAGNTWVKRREYQNAQTGAALGATVSIWVCVIGNSVTSGGTLTTSYAGSLTAAAVTGWAFTLNGTMVSRPDHSGLANDGADAGSMVLTPSTGGAINHLYIRATAAEAPTTTYTATATWTAFTHTSSTTSSGGAATNIGARGEFKIATSTTETSDPTVSGANDHASAACAFDEAWDFEASALGMLGVGG